jgi:hypothetical protein
MDPSPLFIFSMYEPPHFFQRISDPPAHIMAQLGTLTQQLWVRSNGPQRHRLLCLGDEHKPVAGTSEAALYFELSCSRIFRNKQAVVTSAAGCSPSKLLLKYRGWSFGRHKYTQETFAESFRGLHEILSSVDSGFPFVLEFQSQKLAQDGFLPPNTVIQLLPEIKKMTTRSSAPSVSNHSEVVQPNRIPWESFPGPDTESTDFQLHKLIKSIK